MTEPLDLDDTVTVARLRAVVRGQGLSIAAMSKEIRERDAEIARLKAPAAVWEERLGAAHAEIARLQELFRLDGEQHASAVKYARHEQDTRLEAYSTEIDLLRKMIEGHRAEVEFIGKHDDVSCGADAIERVHDLCAVLLGREPQAAELSYATAFLQQYSDERAAAAREAAIEEAAQVAHKYCDNPVGDEHNNTWEAFEQGMNYQTGAIDNAIAIEDAIRALTIKPGARE